MLLRVLIAVAVIGAMSLTALAQTPDQNEATRKATADRLVMGEKACSGCDLFQVDLSYQELPGLDLSGARLRQADLSLSTFDKSKFADANMSIVNAFGLRAENADFTKVDLADATLVGGWFAGSDFTGAKLDNANLSGSDFETSKGLTQTQLNTACGDASTKLPKGLKLQACKG
ncbi:MAG TPA: pentapeptide repeat-containing protein [Hyphomonadaceae bacterium]|nr:pentapeptide repeat-containing protein [Hyphomonadaceae bacterium]HPI48922.1 pentapeptide repeat-containing protein [Hyphomonadaceae bacterium]